MNQKLEKEEPKPPSGIIARLKKYFRNPFFIKTQTVAEVADFLKDAVDQNIIDKEAESIANKAIRLGSTTVKEIMVPKVDMVTVTINEETSVIIDRIIDSGHSRYPVLGAERDEVSGILLAKDILPKIVNGNDSFEISEMLREPNIVEYGTISGLVTFEDILEELVGEIEDEHDTEEDEIIKLSEGRYTADAKIELEVFIDYFKMNIDPMSIDAETLGGFIISSLGVLPKIGDEISLDNITIIVSDADDRKINKVSVKVA